MRGDLTPAGPSGSSGSTTPAPQRSGTPGQHPDVWQALYALHAVYEVKFSL